ncbi:MAG: glycoside hydrolase family 3 C-terminal domain-containing protein [Polyangiaceae bacterium]|nr:glycoside hydrolase family 3 C-terminal domain-containing protein [Polyangiaceae bacterium]
MRAITSLTLASLLALVPVVPACTSSPDDAPPAAEAEPEIDRRTRELVAQMTLAEKVEQLHGSHLYPVGGLWETTANERLGLPGLKMVDGPRGVRAGKATTFPVGMARGATWDPELERRVGEAMGEETAARGGDVLLAPTVNILRHPRWGRAQETYGEDTHHLGVMGAAFVMGAQEHVLASVKHYAGNSIEETRYEVDVRMEARTLREVYLPHFEHIVRTARPGSVMTAYNLVNGQYCSENPHLLRDILKGEWGFDGFVESDWVFGTRSTDAAALAGLDVEMPVDAYFGDKLVASVEAGRVPEAVVDEAARRVVKKQLELRRDHPTRPPPEVVESAPHVALARLVAERGVVLLRNVGDALPLTGVTSLVVVGPLGATANLGDFGSSDARPTQAISPLAGLTARAGATPVTYVAGPTLSAEDVKLVGAASAAVVVVGWTGKDEGERIMDKEGGDRASLRLSADQEAMIHAVAAASPRTIVVLEAGAAVVVRPWVDEVAAVLMAWYPGQEGGAALARLLFGDAAPAGRLPITFPRDEAQLPPFDDTSSVVEYGYLHGYRHVERAGETPEFPFGFGLTYTTFSLSNLRLDAPEIGASGATTARVDVTNTGGVAASELVQLFVATRGSKVERAPRDLRAFARVELAPGETQTVSLPVAARDTAYWDDGSGRFVVEPLGVDVEVATATARLTAALTLR